MGIRDSNLEAEFTLESERTGIVDEPIFQILVLGDWVADGTSTDPEHRRVIEIDRDNFDDVMNGLGVRLALDLAGGTVELEFRSLDDFHPDELYRRLPLFAELREIRKRLRNPDTFNSAAREVREWSEPHEAPADSAIPGEVPPAGEGLLDAILSQPEGGGATPRQPVSSDLSRLIGELVRPHIVKVDEGEQSAMIAAVDEAAADLMRQILHHRSFQLLEASWRGLFFLVRRTDTAPDLKIFLQQLTRNELAASLKNAENVNDSTLYKRVASGRNGDPWTLLVGNYAFGPDVDDTAALIRLGKLCSAAGVPCVSHIRPDVLGVHSLANHPDPDDWDLSGTSDAGKLWSALRGIAESQHLGLVMPRFLCRLPYGEASEPTETFSFEEFVDMPGHDDYLWANGCFIAALLLARSYREFGWDFGGRFIQDVDGLPLHIYKDRGESVYQSCAEVQLSQKGGEVLMLQGIMPIVSYKNMDRVRLLSFQSISDPVRALKGRWTY